MWAAEDCYVLRRKSGMSSPSSPKARGAKRRGFGRLSHLPSGRWQAGYTGPDGLLYRAPMTFSHKADAEGWIGAEKRLIDLDDWLPPDQRGQRRVDRHTAVPTLLEYGKDWIDKRRVRGRSLKPRTREHYTKLLEKKIAPGLGNLPLKNITEEHVESWHERMGEDTPTLRAHAYSLLSSILSTAVKRDLLTKNPCRIEGAAQSGGRRDFEPLTPREIVELAQEMPTKYQLLILLAGWAGLRFGELAELRRKDISVASMSIKVHRGVVRAEGVTIVGGTKSEAGFRTVHVPPHLENAIMEHLDQHAQPGRDGLLFPASHSGNLAPSTLYGCAPTKRVTPEGVEWVGGSNFYRARIVIGRPELRFHDLRHSAAVLAAQTGATLAELMQRLGHSTPQAAMRYQHAAKERDAEIAARLSTMAGEA